MSYLSTTGAFTITNITANRAVASTDGLQDVRDAIGTLIYDVQEVAYNGSLWAFTGNSSLLAYVESTISGIGTFNLLATAIEARQGTTFRASGFSFVGLTETYVLDCQSGGFMTAARVLATFLRYYEIGIGASTFSGLGAATGGRMDVGVATGGR